MRGFGFRAEVAPVFGLMIQRKRMVSGFGFRVSGSEFRISGPRFTIYGVYG